MTGQLEDFDAALNQIERLIQQSREADILAICDELLVRFPDRFELYYHRAQARAVLGDSVGALRDISTAIVLQPGEPALFFFRGTWLINEGELVKGIADLAETLNLETKLGLAYYSQSARLTRAVAYLLLREFERALEDSLAVKPDASGYVRDRVWTARNIAELAKDHRTI